MNTCVILPAAGLGQRFVDPADPLAPRTPKIERQLNGRAVFLRAIDLFIHRADVGQVILAVNPQTIDGFRFKWGDQLGLLGVTLIPGGTKERWETVRLALEHVRKGITHIAVHDAARPLASKNLIDRVFAAAERHHAVVPGLPVANTLKRVEQVDAPAEQRDDIDDILADPHAPTPGSTPVPGSAPASTPAPGELRIIETVPRRDLYEVQTPQVFSLNLLCRGYDLIARGELDPSSVTDDASLVEALGRTVRIVAGDPTNLKLTRPGDLELAEALASKRDAAGAKDLAAKRLFADDED